MQLYFVATLSIIICNAVKRPNHYVGRYEQIILAQRSPIAAYYDQRKVWPTKDVSSDNCGISEKACQALFKPNRWILHGLWPHKRSGSSPRSCMRLPGGYLIDYVINSTQLDRLEANWPQLLPNGNKPISLWELEWNRYGSCVSDIESFNSVTNYFDKALELLNTYNIGIILENSGIIPGKSYALNDTYNLVKNEFKIEPRLQCLIVENTHQEHGQYLLEITICFNKTLDFVNCHHTGYRSCNDSIPLIYAKIDEE